MTIISKLFILPWNVSWQFSLQLLYTMVNIFECFQWCFSLSTHVTNTIHKVYYKSNHFIYFKGVLIDTQYGVALPLVIFGAFAVSSGVLSFFLPETHNTKLTESIEDAEELKRSVKKLIRMYTFKSLWHGSWQSIIFINSTCAKSWSFWWFPFFRF